MSLIFCGYYAVRSIILRADNFCPFGRKLSAGVFSARLIYYDEYAGGLVDIFSGDE